LAQAFSEMTVSENWKEKLRSAIAAMKLAQEKTTDNAIRTLNSVGASPMKNAPGKVFSGAGARLMPHAALPFSP